MKRNLLSALLCLTSLLAFSDEEKKHSIFFGAQDFFIYDGMNGFVTYGRRLDEDNLWKFGVDFKLYMNLVEPFDFTSYSMDRFDVGISVCRQRYFSRESLRPYVGVGARVGYFYDAEATEAKWYYKEVYSGSLFLPFGVEYAFNESFKIGLEGILKYTLGIMVYYFDDWEDSQEKDSLVMNSIDAGDYRLYVAFCF